MRKLILMIAMVALFPMIANANGDDDYKKYFYIGGGVGASVFDSDRDFEVFNELDVDNSSFAAKIYAGYRFHKHIGIEIGLHHFGVADLVPVYPKEHKESSYDYTAKGITLSLLWHAPVTEDFEVFLRTGIAYSALKGRGAPYFYDQDSFAPVLGVGVSYDLGNNFFISPEIEWIPNAIGAEEEYTTEFSSYRYANYDDRGRPVGIHIGTINKVTEDYDSGNTDILSTTLTVGWRF